MIEKLPQSGEGVGGAPPPPFTISIITYKVVVYALAERADTLPLFLLYHYMYSVVAILTNGACRSVVHLDELNVVNLPLVVGLRVAAQYEQHLLPRQMQCNA
jgi:hypothetical protein